MFERWDKLVKKARKEKDRKAGAGKRRKNVKKGNA